MTRSLLGVNPVRLQAFSDLLQFTYMFFTINVIFAQAGVMFYGQMSANFITFSDSL